MNTVVITGVGGFLGSHLCDRLLQMGIKVYGIDVKLEYQSKFTDKHNYTAIVADFEHYKDLHTLIS